jgi:hypothetical protein
MVAARQAELFSDAVLRLFSAKELMALRPVCRYARDAADRYIWTRFASFSGASSVVPEKWRTSPSLRLKVLDKIARTPQRGTLRIASDQSTAAGFFRGLLGPSLGVVLRASPAFTPTLGSRTLESAALLRNPQLKAYFSRCLAADDPQFIRMIGALNAADHPVSLALAPFVEIRPWLLAQVDGFDRLAIRMFPIGHFERENDILSGLNALARKNPRVTLEVHVDHGQVHDTFSEYFGARDGRKKRESYVWAAVQKLMRDVSNVRVFTRADRQNAHDGLILAEEEAPTPSGERAGAKRVILASSPLAQHALRDEDWDVAVRVDELGLFEYMMERATPQADRYDIRVLNRQ